MQRLVEDRAQERDTMFFKTLYRELGRYQEGTIRRAPWSSAPIVFTEDGQLVPASRSYWSEVGPPGPLARRRVHPDIGADPECIRFLEIIGCHVMTSDEVTRAQVLEIFVQHPEKWSALSDEERLELTGHFFRAWQNGVLSTRTLEFLTVKAHDGKWYRPGEVFFSQVFAPSERLEVLLASGLLKVGPEEMRLLSDEYLGLRCGSPYEWRRFFDELGVGRRLVAERLRESFTERVAEEVLIRYEKKSGRRPVRVARSQERGYDFESNGRRIELKGRSDPRPVISLTKQQYQTLHESGSYVYVVSDALNNPELFVLRGKRLLDLVPDPSFAYQEWHGLCEDRYVALADEGEGEIRA